MSCQQYNIRLSKAQISKITQSDGSIVFWFGNLGKNELTLFL